jgi:hypothetical protein
MRPGAGPSLPEIQCNSRWTSHPFPIFGQWLNKGGKSRLFPFSLASQVDGNKGVHLEKKPFVENCFFAGYHFGRSTQVFVVWIKIRQLRSPCELAALNGFRSTDAPLEYVFNRYHGMTLPTGSPTPNPAGVPVSHDHQTSITQSWSHEANSENLRDPIPGKDSLYPSKWTLDESTLDRKILSSLHTTYMIDCS